MGRIYERLRKRSYRRLCNQYDPEFWMLVDHWCYVEGVRDALKAVDRELSG